LAVLASAFLTSCVKEAGPNECEEPAKLSLEFHLHMTGASAPVTRSESTADENRISNTVVLFFRGTDAASKLYAVSEGHDITAGSSANMASFVASLTVESAHAGETFSTVVLANVLGRTLASDFNGHGTTVSVDGLSSAIGSMTLSDLQTALVEMVSGPLQTGSEAFPMYGKIADGIVPANGANQSLDVNLLRDVARVNVYNNATTDFTMSEVYVFRASDHRANIPAADAFGTSSTTSVIKPSIPNGTTAITAASSATNWRYTGVSDNKLEYKVYIPEADTHVTTTGVPGDANHTNRCAIVIGGSYKGADTSYYRVDFTETNASGTKELVDVLRNHSYNITISAVRSGGEDTPEDAYNSRQTNIDATIITWDDENEEVVFDGANWASVRKKKITFADGAGLAAYISAYSNMAPSTWTMNFDGGTPSSETTVSSSYFSVTKPADSTTDPDMQGGDLIIRTLQSIPEDGTTVEETFHIHVGRLDIILTLVQNPYSDIGWTDDGEYERDL
jgi:hypothetical protein